MSAGLTPRQAECLAVIKRLTTPEGVSPSYEQIAAAMGKRSRASAHRVIHLLIERGRLRVKPHHARSIEIVESTHEVDGALQSLRAILDTAMPGADGSITVVFPPSYVTELRRVLPIGGSPS